MSNPDKPKENAASVGAEHGAVQGNLYPNTSTERLEAASFLAHSIAKCDPSDAIVIMSAALSDLSPGGPIPVFENAQSDADFWANLAAPFEIEAYFKATLERLKNLALGIKSRKRVFLNLWGSFSETDRMAFIQKVDPNLIDFPLGISTQFYLVTVTLIELLMAAMMSVSLRQRVIMLQNFYVAPRNQRFVTRHFLSLSLQISKAGH